jgi:rhomboid protease GluP
MEVIWEFIPARSEKQAMDWSLVLVSQGIQTTIERHPDTSVWGLVVQGPDYPGAVQAIQQYAAENRRPSWQQELPWTGLIFDWRSALWLFFLIFLYAVEATGRGSLSEIGMMNNLAVQSGEWWRLFTAVTLHGDLAHLAANVSTGFLLLGLAMGAFGPGIALLASFLAGVGGNLAGYLIYPSVHRGLGASGMVMGALGLLAAQSLALSRRGLTPRQLAARGILSAGLLLVLLGLSPERNVDVLAHVAGFVTGLLLGAMLAFTMPRLPHQPRVNTLALILFCALVMTTWRLALLKL